MSKVLLDTEVLEIISSAIKDDEIDDSDSYRHFLEDLGKLVAEHFGGEFRVVSEPLMDVGAPDETRYCVHFRWNENVPEDGGVYARYDKDVTIKSWKREGRT